MLERVTIQRYRGLRQVDVPLRPLTVLVGLNDTGKSAFLGALRRLVNQEGFEALDCWRLETNNPPEVVGLTPEGRISNRPSGRTYEPGVPAMSPAGFYQLPAAGPEMHSSGALDERSPPQIEPNGSMAPALFDFLLRHDRKRFFAAVEVLRGLVPGLEEVEIATPEAARRRIDLVIDGGLRIPADAASTGVRLLLLFVALAYHPAPPKLILLEEPENGVHPRRLAEIVRLLREITQGKHAGHAAQVVLTTHSPYLLDLVSLETDQVLVFQRENDGSRTAQPADSARLKTFLDEFLLGEVWFNQGEEGLLKSHA